MRLIDADDYRECLCEQLHMPLERASLEISTDYEKGLYDAARLLNTQPTIQSEQRTGKWISADAIFGGVPFYCSECGENTLDTVMGKPRWNFCPNCGADMREVTE